MNTRTLLIGFLTLWLLVGCNNCVSQMNKDAEVCAVAVRIGDLIMAEKYCSLALGDPNADILEPQVKSQRLYELGRIKRQRGKFFEAGPLIEQSLSMEEQLSGGESLAVGRRLFEMSLILAGQNEWQKGAVSLKRLLLISGRYSGKKRKIIAATLNHYARQLKQDGQTDLALKFERKAKELRNAGKENHP